MSKPPKTTPHSDIDGVNQDARPNLPPTEADGSGAELKRAHDQSAGRPPYSDVKQSRDDRSD